MANSAAVDQATETNTYNARLFDAGGLRRYYHLARFKWVRDKVRTLRLHDMRLVELGCFDGRLLEEIEEIVNDVVEYIGLDANWEDGLDLAAEKFSGREGVSFIETVDPSPLRNYPDGHFTAAAALETLEHIPPEMLGDYLDEIARVTRGYFLVTVPNELGPIFLTKQIGRSIFYRDSGHDYSWKDLVAATVGRCDLIERDNHKGFDYRALVREIGKRFAIRSVEGVPGVGLPPLLSPTVGIVAFNG